MDARPSEQTTEVVSQRLSRGCSQHDPGFYLSLVIYQWSFVIFVARLW